MRSVRSIRAKLKVRKNEIRYKYSFCNLASSLAMPSPASLPSSKYIATPRTDISAQREYENGEEANEQPDIATITAKK